MERHIRKAAVLGSGVMGSRIACHFANVGIQVLLLDIAPKELNEAEKAAGLALDNKKVKNRIVNDALQSAIKSNPSPLYKKSEARLISTGNFDDDMKLIADCDWIVEVVVENLNIKKIVFEQVEKFRKPGTLITSNTSGIPIEMMLDGRSEDFQKNFCGTHFFNPPRYLKLLEVIPSTKTDPEVTKFFMEFGDLILGKTTVQCKDTPAFIANRIGVFSIMSLFHLVEEMGLSIDEVDKLTGPALGRPKSATFRTCDVVGLDTLVKVAQGVQQNCPKDEANSVFTIPGYISKMVENNWLGSKTKQGFYKQDKSSGKKEILSLNLKTLEYEAKKKANFATLEMAKNEDNLKKRIKILAAGTDKAGEFYRKTFAALFVYVSNRVPEISDELYKIDAAMKAGFGWELGPFELWDAVGVKESVAMMEKAGVKPAAWIAKMVEGGKDAFYVIENGSKKYYDTVSNSYKAIPGAENFIILDNLRSTKVLWKNTGASIFDLGDGVLGVEFHSKMNTMGGDVIQGINKAIDIAENEGWKGLVIGNQGANFSAGANLGMLFMYAADQEWDEVDFAIRVFQRTMMRVRYSSIPVVVAHHQLALGGGCEIALHADQIQAYAETYVGLVEVGAGLIPGGGGTKEFALRMSDATFEGDIELPALKNAFLTIGMAKVATSAHEAFDCGYYMKGRDRVTINQDRLLTDAKESVLRLAHQGYTQPAMRKNIRVLGREGLGMVYAGANTMFSGGYISEHDKLISEKLGYVMCGGDLSAKTEVSEQYLLDLEREAFLSLCGTKKTLERIQSILTTGKPLRN
ncbi:MAG: 3-hydroxyacyl-CoA dehydrogenase NAD-binding domain-containing protein [Bacteroidetes bacterium]|nr:3-hydroxyacyl-CoA dehydrogenase NAD-binding domain-containing protein [Bacteroidota bacterium]